MINANKKQLLLAAGFSANFGLPLGADVWGWFFNDPEITSDKYLRDLVHSEKNYEEIYHKIISEKSEIERIKKISKCLNVIYSEFDRMINLSLAKKRKTIDLKELKSFINRFAGTTENPGFIFTLNQDLFIERLFIIPQEEQYHFMTIPLLSSEQWHLGRKIPTIKFSSDPKRDNFTEKEKQDGLIRSIYVPTPDEKDIGKNVTENLSTLNYIKLHGSSNWFKKDENDNQLETGIMVIGGNKSKKIEDEPFLKFNYHIFENSLRDNTDLLIIGYGFNDPHINDALIHHNIKIHILSPQKQSAFFESMQNCSQKEEIWKKIVNYYQGDLKAVFPYGQRSKSRLYIQIAQHFFNS